MTKKKLRVAVLFGGRSSEHEISLRSAAFVIRNLDPTRFEVVSLLIDKQGKWPTAYPIGLDQKLNIDVIFPVLHGPMGEDGTVQGFLELAEIPYVGSGVLASALGMDKEKAKRLARDAGFPVVPFQVLRNSFSEKIEPEKIEMNFPLFVKPANMGSSVGVHKVKNEAELKEALKDAFLYDSKVLVEKAIVGREIEVSVLEDQDTSHPPLVSIPGEVIPSHEFYSYEAKYLDENGAQYIIPAQLTPDQVKRAQEIARGVFLALDCEGMGRVDLFLEKSTGQFYFNEINTIPGFTSISMYPKLWEYSGISNHELLSRLVDLAIVSHARKKRLRRDYATSA